MPDEMHVGGSEPYTVWDWQDDFCRRNFIRSLAEQTPDASKDADMVAPIQRREDAREEPVPDPAAAECAAIVALLDNPDRVIFGQNAETLDALVATYIVAVEGIGHNDAPLYCDYDERTQEKYRKLARQMLKDIAAALERGEHKRPDSSVRDTDAM